jgi:uncharacterized protein
MSVDVSSPNAPAAHRWRPLAAIERRLLGVLVEKAKTTPENYPLSLNALRAGCNQKNNRAPQMLLEESQIEEALDSLRKAGAVLLVQGDSRVDRYRHLAYEWFGVDKVELAVLAELLLRGAQTEGELRGRAARMEPIKDLADLQPVLASLEAKQLVTHLTPPGRGSVVSHTLYLDREMEKIRREAGQGLTTESALKSDDGSRPTVRPQPLPTREPHPGDNRSNSDGGLNLAGDVRRLHDEFAELKRDVHAARAEFDAVAQQLRRELEELNRQLGN